MVYIKIKMCVQFQLRRLQTTLGLHEKYPSIHTHTVFDHLKKNYKYLSIRKYANVYILNNCIFKGELLHKYYIPSLFLFFFLFLSPFPSLFCAKVSKAEITNVIFLS